MVRGATPFRCPSLTNNFIDTRSFPITMMKPGHLSVSETFHVFNYTQDYIVVYPEGYDRHWRGPTYAVPSIEGSALITGP